MATGGDTTNDARQLQRGGLNCALADADGDCFSRVPLAVVVLHQPLLRGHQAGLFAGQIDTGLLTEAECGSVLCDAIDTQLVGEGVVEGVARHGNGVVYVDRAVALIAMVVVAVEVCATVAHDVQILGDALLQAGNGHKDFES